MARRSEFKGIARNLAQKLNGRNNDHDGYWAIGQLYLIANQEHVSALTVDLLISANNSKIKSLEPIAKAMHELLFNMLNAHKIPVSWLESANVTFSFNAAYQKQYHYWRAALGTPYLVTLEITLDSGKVHKQTFGGNVNPHDPLREKRRSRF